MREIKFRCWFDNQMHKVVDIDFSYKRINLFGADIIGFKEGVLMQFTGLYDKNGKEIYEGDIVRNYGHDIEDWIVSYEYGKFIGTFDNICEDLYEIHDFEVIGNIYDNPELLGGKDE